MDDLYIIGTACTPFGKFPDKSFKALTREAYMAALADAGLDDGGAIESCWFGNCGMGAFGQAGIRGQVCMTPLVQDGSFPERVPTINVEGACATATLALNGALKDVATGDAEIALAMGVEKLVDLDAPERTARIFSDGGIDQFDPDEWRSYYTRIADDIGATFGGDGTVFMSTYALQASWHMKRWGTTQQQIAAGASKNHHHGSLNDLAQYRFEIGVDEVLADRPISGPLTRSMCAPIGDGAAAALVCNRKTLATLAPETRARALPVLALQLSGGKYREPSEPSLSRVAAQKAYRQAGIGPDDVDIAEVHDATSFCEIYQCEMLGFAADGEGGAYVASGAAALGGERPINLSGGLVSKGHPVGATGLSMIHELGLQLRGEAGLRQAERATIGLTENGGGVIGFDEAACAVTILGAPRHD